MDAKQKFFNLGYYRSSDTKYFIIYKQVESGHGMITFDRATKNVRKDALGREDKWITPEEVAAIQEQLSELGWIE